MHTKIISKPTSVISVTKWHDSYHATGLLEVNNVNLINLNKQIQTSALCIPNGVFFITLSAYAVNDQQQF